MEEHDPDELKVLGTENEHKKNRLSRTGHAFLIGVLIGIAVFAAVKKGFGFPFLLPLFIAFLLLRNGRRSDVEK